MAAMCSLAKSYLSCLRIGMMPHTQVQLELRSFKKPTLKHWHWTCTNLRLWPPCLPSSQNLGSDSEREKEQWTGRERWDDTGEWHWNTYNVIYETSRQSRFDARYWMLGAGALGQPRGVVWGERREEGSGWGTHVYLWQIHFDIWQNQYNIVKFKNKVKLKKKKKLVAICWSAYEKAFLSNQCKETEETIE